MSKSNPTPQDKWPKYWVPGKAFIIELEAAIAADCCAPNLSPDEKERRMLNAAILTLQWKLAASK